MLILLSGKNVERSNEGNFSDLRLKYFAENFPIYRAFTNNAVNQ